MHILASYRQLSLCESAWALNTTTNPARRHSTQVDNAASKAHKVLPNSGSAPCELISSGVGMPSAGITHYTGQISNLQPKPCLPKPGAGPRKPPTAAALVLLSLCLKFQLLVPPLHLYSSLLGFWCLKCSSKTGRIHQPQPDAFRIIE